MYVKRTVRRRGDKEYTYLSLVEAAAYAPSASHYIT